MLRKPFVVFPLLLASVGYAQIPSTEQTVVTLTGEPTSLSTSSDSVSIIGREDLETQHAITAAEALRLVPFLFLSQWGGAGGLSELTLRGGAPSFTTVMIDGIPVNDISGALGGVVDLSTIPTSGIDRIEVVRGPLSSLYGSQAVGGVINVLTSVGTGDPELTVGESAGSFGAEEIHARLAGRTGGRNPGKTSYSLGASYFRIGEQTGNDPFHLASIFAHVHHVLGRNTAIESTLRYDGSHADAYPPAGGGPEYSIIRTSQLTRTGRISGGLTFRQAVSPLWHYALGFDAVHQAQDLDVPPILNATFPAVVGIPRDTSTDFSRYHIGFTNGFNWKRLKAHLAVDGARELGSSTNFLGVLTDSYSLARTTIAPSGEVSYTDSRLSASFGLRYDHASNSSGTDSVARWSPRASASYRLGRTTRFLASWGQAFKLPSFYAYADPLVGNKSLVSEHSNSVDFGVGQELAHGRVSLDATFFRNGFQDLIDFSSQLSKLVNRSEVITRGIEFGSTFKLTPKLSLGANASYMAWSLQPADEPFRGQPHWRGGANATWRPSTRWSLRADTLAVSWRNDYELPVPTQSVAGGYNVVNFATTYTPSPRTSAFVRVENLLDHHYREYVGFPAAGASARVGVEYRLPGKRP